MAFLFRKRANSGGAAAASGRYRSDSRGGAAVATAASVVTGVVEANTTLETISGVIMPTLDSYISGYTATVAYPYVPAALPYPTSAPGSGGGFFTSKSEYSNTDMFPPLPPPSYQRKNAIVPSRTESAMTRIVNAIDPSMDPSRLHRLLRRMKSEDGMQPLCTTAAASALEQRTETISSGPAKQKLVKLIIKNLQYCVLRLDAEEHVLLIEKLDAKRKGKPPKVLSRVFIKEIREIHPLELAGEAKEFEFGSFSIVHGAHRHHLDLVCTSSEQYVEILLVLRYLIRYSHLSGDKDPLRMRTLKLWMQADSNNDGRLDMTELSKLLHLLNIEINNKYLRKTFKEFDVDHSGFLDFKEFSALMASLTELPQSVEALFEQYLAQGNHVLFPYDLARFVNEYQFETKVLLTDCYDIVNKHGFDLADGRGKVLALENFGYFLMSANDNSALNPELYKHYEHLMTRPLSHYRISSSHNTYLVRHQLKGRSDADMYRRVLLTGCRCVELDCWDGPNGYPIIFHGHTLVSKIAFSEAVEVIAKYAFVKSQYPVILSLEVHCSIPQQDRMAEIMMETFGDKLLPKLPPTDSGELPSPLELKGKILLKGKCLPPYFNSLSQEDLAALDEEEYTFDADELDEEELGKAVDEDSDYEETEAETETERVSVSMNAQHSRSNTNEKSWTVSPSGGEDSGTDITSEKELQEAFKKGQSQHKRNKVSKALSDITAISAKKFKSFASSMEYQPWEMHSFSEEKILKVIKREGHVAAARYNARAFARVYPKGTRFDSSNYSPVPAWIAGCQLVALNFYTYDKFLRMNEAIFAENGKCGFVLKPNLLRHEGISSLAVLDSISPFSPATTDKRNAIYIEIIGAINLPKKPNGRYAGEKGEIVDPFVRVEIIGTPRDKHTYDTKTIWNNGFNPTWDEVTTVSLLDPELDIVRIAVYDKSPRYADVLLCENYFPVQNLRYGFRAVSMMNLRAEIIEDCVVFCRFLVLNGVQRTFSTMPEGQ